MKQAVQTAESFLGPAGTRAGNTWFIALRFGLAALLLLPFRASRSDLGPAVWRGGLFLGAILLGGFLLQMAGLEGVSPAVSAFLTSLYVLFTALLVSARRRSRPSLWLGLGVIMATLGGAYIGGPPQLSFGLAEWLTVGCAFLFAIHILVTDALTKRHSPMSITLTSFVIVALGAVPILWLQMRQDAGPSFERLLDLAQQRGFLVPLLCSTVFATALALSLMNLYQRALDPIRAAILYALEPVWAALIAWALGLGAWNLWLLLGGSALLAGNLVAELGPLWQAQRRRAGAAMAGGPESG
jgi:drug/metabolite transporter (DMT)-like permease